MLLTECSSSEVKAAEAGPSSSTSRNPKRRIEDEGEGEVQAEVAAGAEVEVEAETEFEAELKASNLDCYAVKSPRSGKKSRKTSRERK